MASQPPFILADNVVDRINLYPLATLRADAGQLVGREANYAADYRRERTYFGTASVLNPQIISDLGVGNTAVIDTVWIDRGHNLWGRTLRLDGSPDGHLITTADPVLFTYAVPAQGTVGGDPTTGWCVTEEGALYTLVVNALSRRSWRLYDMGTGAWIMPGIIIGRRCQLLNYSSVLDEDEGERDERQENSLIKGYYGRDRIYTGRKLRVQLATIGVTDYDTNIRSLRRLLFEKDQPAFIVMNYGRWPERGWLYQYQGAGFSAPAERVYRRASFVMAELGPLIR